MTRQLVARQVRAGLWTTRRAMGEYGSWFVAAFLLIVAVVMVFAGVVPQQRALAVAARQLHAAAPRAAAPALGGTSAANAGLLERLPAASAQDRAMRSLFTAAAAEGLTLEQGEYQRVEEPDVGLVRYELALPVKGSYVQVRRFLTNALNADPALALTGITLTRQRADEAQLAADIKLVLFMRMEVP